MAAWGNAPGMTVNKNPALKARFSLTEAPSLDETRFQRLYLERFNFPGALPQTGLICAVSAKQNQQVCRSQYAGRVWHPFKFRHFLSYPLIACRK